MNIESFAIIYVYYLEPALKVAAVTLAVITILHVLNLVFSGGKAFPVLEKIFNTMIKAVFSFFIYAGKMIMWSGRLLFRTLTILFDTVRDFFTSKI